MRAFFIAVSMTFLAVTAVEAQQSKVTRDGAMICGTLQNLDDFWIGVANLPPGVSVSQFAKAMTCTRGPGGLPYAA